MTNAIRRWRLCLSKAIRYGTSIRGKFKWLRRTQKHALTKDCVLRWLSEPPNKNIRNKMTHEDGKMTTRQTWQNTENKLTHKRNRMPVWSSSEADQNRCRRWGNWASRMCRVGIAHGEYECIENDGVTLKGHNMPLKGATCCNRTT